MDKQVERRGFGTSSEYLRHLIRRDQEAQSPILHDPLDLAEKVRAGLESGPATPLNRADIDGIRADIQRQAGLRRSRRKSA